MIVVLGTQFAKRNTISRDKFLCNLKSVHEIYLFSGLRRILLFEGCEPFGYRIYPYFFEKIIRNRMSGDL